MSEEIWKDIPGYEGIYQVSNKGVVKSLERLVLSRGAYRRRFETTLTLFLDRRGYLMAFLSKEGGRITRRVHRLVMLSFYGPSKLTVDHINSIKTDNRLENLEYVTNRENCSRSKEKRDLPTGVYHTNGRYSSGIVVNNKRYHLGMFDTPELAYNQYVKAVNDLPNIDLYVKKSRKNNIYGTGIRQSSKNGWAAYCGSKYLGTFYTLDEAVLTRKKYKNEV